MLLQYIADVMFNEAAANAFHCECIRWNFEYKASCTRQILVGLESFKCGSVDEWFELKPSASTEVHLSARRITPARLCVSMRHADVSI